MSAVLRVGVLEQPLCTWYMSEHSSLRLLPSKATAPQPSFSTGSWCNAPVAGKQALHAAASCLAVLISCSLHSCQYGDSRLTGLHAQL